MFMEKLKLNTHKILAELDQLGKNKTWLAGKMKNTPAMVTYILRYRPITFASKIAKILGLDPKDLIK